MKIQHQQKQKHRQMKINEEQQQQQQNEQKWTKTSGGSLKQVLSLGVFDYFMVIADYLWFM